MTTSIFEPSVRARLVWRLFLLGVCALPFAAFAQSNAAPQTGTAPSVASQQLPTTDSLMASLLARLPAKPILVTGDLTTTTADGSKTKLTVAILLCYPRMARYTISDAFGRQLEQLTVTRDGAAVTRDYELGDPATRAATPALSTRIQNTALSWMDLTLDFLWWRGGSIIGRDESRGQPCYVLDRHARDPQSDAYASVRMWVDTRVSMLLQAEGFDKLGECQRRLSVKSFKKINDEWMIKDLEVEELPSGSKTVLRVRDAAPVDAKS